MTTAVATRDPATETRLFDPQGPTLEDRVLASWDELVGEGRTECPVCGDSMSAAGGCESCGSELS